jgi:hypothetical protein
MPESLPQESSLVFHLNDLQPGIYFLKFQASNWVKLKKLIINK